MNELVASDILLILSSGFLGALLIKIMDWLKGYLSRPILKINDIKFTPSIDTSHIHLSVIIGNSGKQPASKCFGKLILRNKGTEKVYYVPWGTGTNPDKFTIYHKDEVKLDLFVVNRTINDAFVVPQAVGDRGSNVPGEHLFRMIESQGIYEVEIKIIGENAYLERKMGKIKLPDYILQH